MVCFPEKHNFQLLSRSSSCADKGNCCTEGLYTEMDFRNEALNALRMKELLRESEFVDSEAIVIPEPNLALTTRCAVSPALMLQMQGEGL